MGYQYISVIGQDSHRFSADPARPLMLGGCLIPDSPGLDGNSDADVILHAVTNAISGYTGLNILGARADAACRRGLKDSRVYLQMALEDLAAGSQSQASLWHCSLTLEASRPRLAPHIDRIRTKLAELLGLRPAQIGLTATSGEGLSAAGSGEGMACFCCLTIRLPEPEPDLRSRAPGGAASGARSGEPFAGAD
ncbi:MAG: 2-C-methyl-D-erythritol 2,4-cyclodiphosphate synthase [Oscillospiraceae bacterium]|nr:2-C-methyl-D-erythritol 2,4-cyclodiphosphate synthase [Oscillospiraceae bacterium]